MHRLMTVALLFVLVASPSAAPAADDSPASSEGVEGSQAVSGRRSTSGPLRLPSPIETPAAEDEETQAGDVFENPIRHPQDATAAQFLEAVPVPNQAIAHELPPTPPNGHEQVFATESSYGCYSCGGYHGCGRFGGCGICGCKHRGYPERPFGQYFRMTFDAHIARGVLDQMVLYRYDFQPGEEADHLSLRGIYQLQKHLGRWRDYGFPILIQTTPGEPELDQARREHVLSVAQQLEPGFTEDWIAVDRPHAVGLSGEESYLIYDNLLLNTLTQGQSGASGIQGPAGISGGGSSSEGESD